MLVYVVDFKLMYNRVKKKTFLKPIQNPIMFQTHTQKMK